MIAIESQVISVITRRVSIERKHMVDANAFLSELGLCSVTKEFTIPVDLEEEFSLDEIPYSQIEKWERVEDVIATVTAMRSTK